MNTAGERIKARREELGWSMGELSRRSGVSMGHLSKLESGERGERMGQDILTKLADALGVAPKWLGTGRGAKEAAPERIVEKDERYQNRAIAAKHARDDGVSEEAVASVLGDELDADEDPSVIWWIDRMRMRETILRRQGPVGTPVKTDEIPPPRGPRKRTGT